MIIGTAGHIDHGKTALVKALTGVDGDRLKEEKARGITIDLGFAYLPVPNEVVLGFVDVPGHERFVHTMLAGASGIDFALLAVAADDGIKPQTLEHLAIIDLLGIERGFIALTKADLATPDRLAEITADIKSATAGTALAAANILPVSALTGQGIDDLRAQLAAAAAAMTARPADGAFRLAVDRAFTLSGAGLVVTGTVLSGSVRVGDRVTLSPSGLPARIRSLHAQNRPAETGRAGDRCALNLAGPDISRQSVRRGDIVLDPALHAPADRIDAVLRLLPGESKPMGQWFPVRLHHAATEAGARIVLLGPDPIRPGETSEVQLVLDRKIAAAAGDYFVIRDASAQRTIGGGRFIDLRGPARKRRSPERQAQRAALAVAEPEAAFAALLAAPPYAADFSTFIRDRALSTAQAEQLAEELGPVILQAGTQSIAISPQRWRLFTADLTERLTAFHTENPDLQGIGRERLRVQMTPRLPPPAFIAALQAAARQGALVLDGAFVRLAAHTARLTPRDASVWAAAENLIGGAERFRPPRIRDVAASLRLPETDIRRVFKLAGRLGRADEIAHDHYFLRPAVHEMAGIIAEVAQQAEGGAFTAAQFRDRLDNGRKVAIQILEFFDRHGLTLRRGDLRLVDRRRLDAFAPAVLPCLTDGGESPPVGRSDFKSEWGGQTVPGGFDSRSLPPARAGRRA